VQRLCNGKHTEGSQIIGKYGRPVGTRTPDLYRVKVTLKGFTTTYKTAGTAKVRGSSYKTYFLWVGLWVGNVRKESGVIRCIDK
jgi:hypothetical protein